MLKPAVRDFLTGVTVVAGAAGLVFMLFLFGDLAEAGKRTYEVTVRVTNASGIGESSPVTIAGVRIGRVSGAKAVFEPEPGAVLTLRINRGVSIPRGSRVFADTGLLGDSRLELIPPTGWRPGDATVLAGEMIEAGEPETLLGRVSGSVREPLADLGRAAAAVERLAERYTTLGDQLIEMTAERSTAEVDGGAEPNLRTVLARLDTALRGASTWLNDAQLLGQTQGVLARMDETLTQAQSLATAWTKSAANVDAASVEVTRRVGELTEAASATLASTQRAADELAAALEGANQGRGTVGQLLTNPDLYKNLNDAALRLDATLTDLKLLIEKFRAEGVPIRL